MPNPTAEDLSPAVIANDTRSKLTLRAFEPGDETAFRMLNEQWIAKYFRIEEKDHEVLRDPAGKILARGGAIYLAVLEGVHVGTCALLAMQTGEFEVAKMAVEERRRGVGIGRGLLEFTVEQARKRGARRLYLETNHQLKNAIHLYESVGFRHLEPDRITPSPYARADVFMEMLLQA